MTDPISDMLTRIRNAAAVKKAEVVLPYSNFKHQLGQILEHQGWIEKVEITEKGQAKNLRLVLKYGPDGQALLSSIQRISKPGQRIYAKVADIPKLHTGMGIVILSTPKGLRTHVQARKEKVGGEVICQIW